MTVCLDTNIVVQALAQQHSFHAILDHWVAGQLSWVVSTPVLLEYEEVLTRVAGAPRWRKLARLMDLAELTSGNLLRVTPSFHFQIISTDPDDNIFTDCAITGNADFLVTEDRHFAPLLTAGFKPKPIHPAQFMAQVKIGSGTI